MSSNNSLLSEVTSIDKKDFVVVVEVDTSTGNKDFVADTSAGFKLVYDLQVLD